MSKERVEQTPRDSVSVCVDNNINIKESEMSKEHSVQDLRNMEIHTTVTIENGVESLLYTEVMRVAHGFIYTRLDKAHGVMTSTFVKY